MKKTLLALAIGSVIAAPSLALADANLYGKLNLSVDHVDYAEGAGLGGNHQLNTNKSYFGVRGGSDVSDGLKGIFQLEFGVNVDSQPIPLPGFQLFTLRNSFLGVEGGFGTLKAGTFDTPLRGLSAAVDQFHDQIYADSFNLMAGEWRAENIIQYSTPKLADMLTLNVATVLPEGDDSNFSGNPNQKAMDTLSITAMFDLDSFYAGLGYDRNNYALTTDNGSDLGFTQSVILPGLSGAPSAGTGGGIDVTGGSGVIDIIRAVAGFNADSFQVGLLLQEAKDTKNSSLKDFTWILSAGFDMSENIKLKAQYGATDAKTADLKSEQATIGADYKLGAQTKTYAYATRFEIDGDRNSAVVGIGAEHRF